MVTWIDGDGNINSDIAILDQRKIPKEKRKREKMLILKYYMIPTTIG